MANATSNLMPEAIGTGGPLEVSVPVKGSTHVYKGTSVAQHSGGYFVPTTTAGGGAAMGVAQHEANNTGSDGDSRVVIETRRLYAFSNATAGDAFSDISVLGAPVYATDDHTVADNSSTATRKCMGWFAGFEADGKVRVFMDPGYAYLVNAINALQLLTDTPATADALRDNIVSVMGTGML